MGLVSEIMKIQSLGNNFSIFFLLFTSYNFNNSYFLLKYYSKFHKKLLDPYSKGIIVFYDCFLTFLLIFTIYNLNNWNFICWNCKKFHNKQVGQY